MEVLWFIGTLVTAIVVVKLLRILSQRRFVPDHYEWLAVMSHADWKSLEKLCAEMRERKRTTCTFHIIVGNDLSLLIEEGYVEHKQHLVMVDSRIGVAVEKFRMTSEGFRRRVLHSNSAELDLEDALPA